LARLDEHVECSARFPTFEIDLKNAPSVSFFGSIFSWSICYFYAPLAIAVAVVTLIAGYLMKGNAEILSDVLDHLGVSCRHFTGSDTRSLSPYKAHRSAPPRDKGLPSHAADRSYNLLHAKGYHTGWPIAFRCPPNSFDLGKIIPGSVDGAP
jgi:hypothetical protein